MNILIFILLCIASAAAVWLYVRHIQNLDDITNRAHHYRQDHPAYLRDDDLRMIDLTRRLPTLQSSLTPGVNTGKADDPSSAAEDIVAAIVLTAMGTAGIFLTFSL